MGLVVLATIRTMVMVVLLLVLPWAHAALSGSAHTSGQGGRDHRKSQFFTRLHGNSSEAMAKAELQQRQRQQPAKNVCEEGFTDFDCNSKCSRDCQECRDLSGCWARCYNACHREREIRDRSEECFRPARRSVQTALQAVCSTLYRTVP